MKIRPFSFHPRQDLQQPINGTSSDGTGTIILNVASATGDVTINFVGWTTGTANAYFSVSFPAW